jgi:hypothetical protein
MCQPPVVPVGIAYSAVICKHMCSQKSQANAQVPQRRAAKPSSTHEKESQGVYKQSNQQKGVTRSVYMRV